MAPKIGEARERLKRICANVLVDHRGPLPAADKQNYVIVALNRLDVPKDDAKQFFSSFLSTLPKILNVVSSSAYIPLTPPYSTLAQRIQGPHSVIRGWATKKLATDERFCEWCIDVLILNEKGAKEVLEQLGANWIAAEALKKPESAEPTGDSIAPAAEGPRQNGQGSSGVPARKGQRWTSAEEQRLLQKWETSDDGVKEFVEKVAPEFGRTKSACQAKLTALRKHKLFGSLLMEKYSRYTRDKRKTPSKIESVGEDGDGDGNGNGNGNRDGDGNGIMLALTDADETQSESDGFEVGDGVEGNGDDRESTESAVEFGEEYEIGDLTDDESENDDDDGSEEEEDEESEDESVEEEPDDDEEEDDNWELDLPNGSVMSMGEDGLPRFHRGGVEVDEAGRPVRKLSGEDDEDDEDEDEY